MRRFHFALLAFLCLFISGPVRAQVNPGTESGIPAYGRFSGSDFDKINLSNGNLHLDIPVLTVKERGRTLTWRFTFDPLVWNLTWYPLPKPPPPAQDPSYYSDAPAGYGGGLVLSSPFSSGDGGPGVTRSPLTCPYTNKPYEVYTGFTAVDQDGTLHPLPIREEISQYLCYGSTLSGPSTDGSGIYFDLATDTETLPDGTRLSGSIEDANGNNLVTSSMAGYNPYGLSGSYTDTLNRNLISVTQGPNFQFTSPLGNTFSAPQYTLFNVTDTNGQQQVYRIDYQLIDVQSDMPTALKSVIYHRNCYCGDSTYALVAQKLTLPNSKTYVFSYNNDTPGQLARVDLPTGAYITYTYTDSYFLQLGTLSHTDPGNYSGRQGVTSRTVHENGNTYTWNYGGIPNGVTTVTDPDGNVQVHSFGPLMSGNFYSDAVYEQSVVYKDSSGNVLRTVSEQYAADVNAITGFLSGGRVISVTTTLDNGLVNQKQTDYETFQYNCSGSALCPGTTTRMNPTEIREYDYGNGAPGPLVRRTDYTYLHNNPTNGSTYVGLNIVNKVASVIVYDGSGNQLSKVVNEYDNYTAGITASGAIQHDSNYGTSYATRGNLTAVSHWRNTDGAMLTSRNQYDDAGNMTSTTDPLGHTTSYDYTDSWYSGTGGSACAPSGQGKAYLTKITNASNQVTTHSYYSCSGLPASTTDPNNQTSKQTYDLFSRPLVSTLPDGGQTTNTYDDTNLITTTSKLLSLSAAVYSREHYDQLGRLIESDLCEDGTSSCTSPIETNITYDGVGNTVTQTNPFRATTDSTYGLTTYAYDALYRTKTVTKPDGSIAHSAYCGPNTLVTDEASHWRRSRTDGLGHLVEVDEPNSTTATVNSTGCPGTGEPIWVTSYTYDALGNLKTVVQGGSRNRSFTYDSLNHLLTSTNPEAGLVTYTYDNDGNVLTKKDARAITTTYSYDALNRAKGATYSNGDPAVSYTYDQSACLGQPTCYNIGRRTSMSDAGGTENLSYDTMSRELTEQRTTNSVTKSTSYTYNLAGDLATLTYPSGRMITYTYDSSGRSSTAKDVANGINYAYGTCNGGACYAPQGAVAAVENGTSLAATYLYNTRLQPCWLYASTNGTLAANTSCTATDPGPGNILDLKYSFNLGAGDNGNVVGITNNRDTTRTQSFTYDQVNRIVTAQTSATTGTNCWGETYTLDQWANMTAIGALSGYTGCTQEGLSVAATTVNQLSATGLTYDASGNMLTDGLNTYGWNAESEIKSAAGVNYTYDGDGNRLQKSNGKIYWYGAGTEILDESDASGNFTNEYVFFGGKRIAMRNVSSGTIYYYAEDMLGSSRTLVQAGQTSVCYDADFYPFGGERDIVTTCSQNYKFEGKERDTETNNDDFGARYYSSRFGRWLSADWSSVPAPVPYANLTNPQTLNLYAMVSDNPETFADLDGHELAQSSTSTVTERECDDKMCTTINNAGQCEGSGCPSQTAQQQQSQTADPQAAQPPQTPQTSQASAGALALPLIGRAIAGAESGAEAGGTAGTVEPGGGNLAGAVGGAIVGGLAAAVAPQAYAKAKDEAGQAWTKLKTAIKHHEKLSTNPDKDPRNKWKQTMHRVANEMDEHANNMKGHQTTANAIRFMADVVRSMIPGD